LAFGHPITRPTIIKPDLSSEDFFYMKKIIEVMMLFAHLLFLGMQDVESRLGDIPGFGESFLT